MNPTRRRYARTAGLLYLLTHVTSVLAVVAYGAGAAVGGVTLEFTLAVGCLGTGVLLWILLWEYGPARAATFALLRTVEAAVIVAGTLPVLASHFAGAGGPVAAALREVHTAAFLVGQGLVISVNTIVLGALLLDSRTVPWALAVLGLAGGTIVLVSDLAQLWGLIPLNGAAAGAAAVPIFAFEIWFAVHLIVAGLRAPDPAPPVTGNPVGSRA